LNCSAFVAAKTIEMGNTLKKTLVALAIAVMALVSVPSAALAYSSDTPTVTGDVVPGNTVLVTWPSGTFVSFEPLTVNCNCTSGTPTLTPTTPPVSSFHAVVPPVYQANAAGGFSILVTLPNVNFGTCSISANGVTVNEATGALTYTPNDLPHTGANVGLYLWVGAGALGLGIAFFVVFAARRRTANKN
jgi:LPXTG-motif cell wall-anchored protein